MLRPLSLTGENVQRSPRVADVVQAVADAIGATPARVALAWLPAQGDDIAAPTPARSADPPTP